MTSPREGAADAGGVHIRFRDHGGDGHPLVLVHATGFHGRVWDPWLGDLAGRYRVVTIDQRGHGDSDKPESGYEWELFGADVLAVVDELGLQRPFGVGHSAGGAAVLLAEGARPQTFERLVLLDPVTPAPGPRSFMAAAQNPLAEGARRRRAVWDSPEQMIERISTNSPMATWRPEFRESYVRHGTRPVEGGRVELKCPPHIEAQVYEMSNRHHGYDLFASVACPTLLVAGEHSPMWAQAQRDAVAGLLPNGRVEVVAGGGHFFPMEQPAAAIGLVTSFLSE